MNGYDIWPKRKGWTRPAIGDWDEVLFIVKGKAKLSWDDNTAKVGAGDFFLIPPNKKIQIISIGNEPANAVWMTSPPVPKRCYERLR